MPIEVFFHGISLTLNANAVCDDNNYHQYTYGTNVIIINHIYNRFNRITQIRQRDKSTNFVSHNL